MRETRWAGSGFPVGIWGYAMNSEPATIVAYILSLIDKREVMPLKEHN